MIRPLRSQAMFHPGLLVLAGTMTLGLATSVSSADVTASAYRITVNSALDGSVAADVELTLREAILLANHELSLEDLSQVERGLVTPITAPGSIIEFELPSDDRVIELVDLLPSIATADVVIDGTTQPGYGETVSAVDNIPTPGVSITAAPGEEVFRGLTITADSVTVRGMSLYGFRAQHRATQTTPPADIFISNAPPPADASPASPPVSFFQFQDPALAPQDVVIELNWLGITPDESIPEHRSAFGVSVFNGVDTVVRQNRIQHHQGSGVITAVRAQGLRLTENVILGNGVAGMPDAVRLEGQIEGTVVTGNLICGNDGSGLFLFKPEGASLIQGNDIRFNGRRFERAAVYLMGRGHQVLENTIGYQPGPGVAISAFPRSDRNLIRHNRFTHLDGLSIDLGADDNTGVRDFQQADGPNPPRNSYNRRLDTANGAINAPGFDQYEFGTDTETTLVTGNADPGSEVDIYQVVEGGGPYSPLDTPLTTVTADEQGRFQLSWEKPEGTWLSAIASDPLYGTSEPSPVVKVLGSEGTVPERSPQLPYTASCLPPAVAAEPPPPEPLQLRVPRNIHFALDRSNISPESAVILDQIVAVMQQYSFLVIELRGHTDPRASAAYNQALSERRALAAREYLLRQGIAPERLRILPLGESQRATSGNTRLDYARDRRVEFIFLDTRGLEIIFEAQESDLQIEP
ncbi:ell envolope biogensis protein [Halomicronema hongdechloris C2206]|uniref:Ell envolope biogensis protein n=1 Tax=Halomicronema hongdechloris C2206 TaxID=1641165 RepID=A0A1Z3HP27_9CYAN|nr:OmpA family protein [Halomicronema hongdechloris]ASC72051.1 ell envolope biogensis protein [Halomicronema hongdechloris C2206]